MAITIRELEMMPAAADGAPAGAPASRRPPDPAELARIAARAAQRRARLAAH
jgi:hypothetical protein